MKKTSFLKKLTAMAATLAMTCVMAVGAFAAEDSIIASAAGQFVVHAGTFQDLDVFKQRFGAEININCRRRARSAQRICIRVAFPHCCGGRVPEPVVACVAV